MTANKKIVVTAPGSLGDVNPLLAIARGLREAGRQVVFFAAERYLPLAERAGLVCESLVSEEQLSTVVENPRLWHPRHGARLILDAVVGDFLQDHYAWLEQHCDPAETILVSHMLDFAGRVYRDRHPESQMVTIFLAPAVLRSTTTPPRLSGFASERWFPKSWLPMAYRAADWWLDRIGVRQINDLRRQVGLNPVSRFLKSWWFSPDMSLGMFPDWFSIASEDLPPRMHCVGFPLADSWDVAGETASKELATVLQVMGDRPPIVFAPGTAHHRAGDFLRTAAEVCTQLEKPAILLSTDPTQIPENLPANIVGAKYLPFSRLLPKAQAIVHHGGVGTTSQALAAGIPQIVTPLAFDQFDNAERVQRLGCGNWLPMRKVNRQRLKKLFEHLPLNSQHVQAVRQKMHHSNQGVARAVKLIQTLDADDSTSDNLT